MQTKKEIIAITITLIIIYKGHLYHNWVKEIVGITLSFYNNTNLPTLLHYESVKIRRKCDHN